MGIWELDLVTNKMRCSSRHDQIFGSATHQSFFDFAKFVDNFVSDDRGMVTTPSIVPRRLGTLNSNIEFAGLATARCAGLMSKAALLTTARNLFGSLASLPT